MVRSERTHIIYSGGGVSAARLCGVHEVELRIGGGAECGNICTIVGYERV